LSFEEGDLLYITDMTNKDWWNGKCGNASGLIPSNYVQESMEQIDNPLHEAAKRGNINFLNECVGNRMSVNGLDKAGSTPLHWAAHGGHVDCVQRLLSVPNCEVDVQNKLGDTPLHAAAWRGHADIVEMLLNKGAIPDILNNDDKTPYDLASDAKTAALLQQSLETEQSIEQYCDEEGDSD
jgi:ankyrin repeat protein